MGKAIFLFLFVLFCLIHPIQAENNPPELKIRRDPYARFQHFRTNYLDELGAIHDILQDRTGFIWFAGTKGLGRFDGFELRKYMHEDLPTAIADSEISCLTLSPIGSIWVGTRSGVCRYNAQTDDFTTVFGGHLEENVPQSVDSIYVRAMLFENDSVLWLETADGTFGVLNVLTGDYQRMVKHEPVTQSYYFYHRLVKALDGDFYLGGRGTGPFRYSMKDSSIFRLPVAKPEVPGFKRERDVSVIFQDKPGQLWIGGLEGLYSYSIEKQYFTKYWTGTVYDMISDKRGYYWLGTGSGACRINPVTGQTDYYINNNNDPQSIGGEKIYCIFEDRSGRIWLAHDNGISTFQPLRDGIQYYFHIPGMDNSPSSSRITSFAEADHGKLWVGTSDEGLNLFDYDNITFERFWPINEKADVGRHIRCLAKAPQSGDLFIGYWSGRGFGRYVKRTNTFKRYRFDKETLNKDWYNDMVFDSAQTLYLGFWGGPGLTAFDTRTEKFGKNINDCFSRQYDTRLVTSLLMDSRNVLLVGTTDAGIQTYHVSTGVCNSYMADVSSSAYFLVRPINDIVEDKTGRIWACGQGLYQYDEENDQFNRMNLRSPFNTLEIYQLLPEGNNALWLLTERGLCKYQIDKEWLTDFSVFISLRFKDDKSAICRLKDGRIALGGENGIAVIDPDLLGFQHSFPRIFLTHFEVQNQVYFNNVADMEEIVLPYNKNFFTIHYGTDRFESGISYTYFFKLEGFDIDWKPLSSLQGAVDFTNVPPGKYTFRMRAGDDFGNMGNEETKLVLVIMSPWWKQWWFIVGTGLFVILVAAFLWRRYLLELSLSYQNIELNQKLLRLQMNPHFIFNSLTAIQNYIYSHQSQLAGEFLSDFARLIRLILDNSRHEFISLEKEIETLQLYMQLQTMRFNNGFDFSVDIDPDIIPEITLVPPMLAQPFLENAIEHGIMKKKERGYIKVKYTYYGQTIRFEITDNGIGLTASGKQKNTAGIAHESVSIEICKERLTLLHKRNRTKINFTIEEISEDNQITGTRVVFDIPAINQRSRLFNTKF